MIIGIDGHRANKGITGKEIIILTPDVITMSLAINVFGFKDGLYRNERKLIVIPSAFKALFIHDRLTTGIVGMFSKAGVFGPFRNHTKDRRSPLVFDKRLANSKGAS